MSAVNESITREFFELHGFFVRTHRKYTGRGEEEMDLLIANPHPIAPPDPRPFVLAAADLTFVPRAIVAVKGWHTETFSAARLISTPEILRFAQPNAVRKTSGFFGTDQPVWKILVLPELPSGKAAYAETLALLASKGIDAVILFRTVLSDLVEAAEANRNYQKSDLLQLIRILKTYDFIKGRQLELFKSRKRKRE